jgi:hypothetical protein
MNHKKIPMKTNRTYIVPFLALFLVTVPLRAQDQRTLETRVADLLVQVPAGNPQKLDMLMQSMGSLEDAGLQMILDGVIPPGSGDDTQARVAIESYSRYLSQEGLESEWSDWEGLILNEIENRKDTEVQRFFISQLNYAGSEAALVRLVSCLTDPDLQDPVIRAIRDISPEQAADLFAARLKDCGGRTQIALVNAIMDTGSPDHARDVAELSGTGSFELQKSVLACLARLGHPGSYGLLAEAAKEADYLPEPTYATASLIAYAQALSDGGHRDLSNKICRNLSRKCNAPGQLAYKSAALTVAAGNEPADRSVSVLVEAMKDPSKAYRMTAIQYAAAHNSPPGPWISELERTRSNEVKAEILHLLRLLESDGAVHVVSGYLDHPDAGVRQEAVKTLALIRKTDAVPDLLRYTLSFPEAPDSATAREALLQTAGVNQLPMLTAALDEAPEGAVVILIEVIAARGDPGSFEVLYDLTKKTGAVRKASLANLYQVASQRDLGDLMRLFDQLEDEQELAFIEKALVSAINRGPYREVTTQALLLHAARTYRVEKYIGVLARIGGREAMEAVHETYTTGNQEARERALAGLLGSNDIHAAGPLFEICSTSTDPQVREAAYRQYIRIASAADLSDDQKLLLLRKIGDLAGTTRDKIALIRAMGRVKTYLSFITLSTYLDQDELKSQAANALVSVVLPGSGMDNGLTGSLVREKLILARDLITGSDSEYLRIDIQNYLDRMPDEKGFVPMFNGSDLSGWQGLAADPVTKAGLSEGELQKRQQEANEKLTENWGVRDHCIVFNGEGSNLCSIKEYGDIELIVDWRITKKGDSGIYLRGSPQVQIWDTSRVEVGAQVGSGGLYNNQVHESKPLVVADNPVGDWNTFRIRMVGEKVTVYLNGQLVVDNVVMENYWDRNIPIYPVGSIELQAHGTDLAFRDIYVRELEEDPNELSAEEQNEGFASLFNGKDLSDWTGKNHSYSVEDGCIVIRPARSGGNLYTEKEYGDFIFRFEFKLTPGANNGLGIRAPLEGDAAYVGYELQILDNTAPVYADLQPYQYHGSVYGIIPALRGYLKPVGEWNYQEVYAKGDHIRITLNGTVILDGNLKEATQNGTADHRDHPGLGRTRGHIGFLGHGSTLWFRHIRIREL